jgi:hypothetical protein
VCRPTSNEFAFDDDAVEFLHNTGLPPCAKRPEFFRQDGRAVCLGKHRRRGLGHEIFGVTQHAVHIENDTGKVHEA